MMKNSNSKILTALVIFLLLYSKAWAGTTISPEVIQETALKFLQIRSEAAVGQIKLWRGASLSDPVPYYDFFGKRIAYCFSVVNKGKTLGYIILSNKETEHPIQEFSTSLPPHERALAICKKEAEKYLLANRLSGHLGEPSFIYISPSIYFFRFSLLDESGKETKSIFVEMRSATVVSNLKTLREAGFIRHNRRRNPYWSSMGNKSPNRGDESFSYLQSVPLYDFFISSHPTAAAMVLGHWNLKRQEEPAKSFIGEIANYIRTCGCGKREEILEMARGIKSFSALRGYRVKAREWVKRSTSFTEQMTFEDYQKEISAGRAVVISFMHKNKCARDIYSAKRCNIQTCVAGVGYLVDSTGRYIIAHEGFFFREKIPEQMLLGNLYSRPGVVFYNWDSIASNIILTTVNKPERF